MIYKIIIGILLAALAVFGPDWRYVDGFIKIDHPAMLGWLKLSTYGIMMAVGFLTANFLLQKEFRRLQYDEKLADRILIGAIVGGLLGSKIAFIIEQYADIHSFSQMIDMFFSGGGLTWYGGLIVAAGVIIFFIKREKLSALHIADVVTPMLASGYGFGRLGCLISGDGCYGQKCDLNLPVPFCDSFPRGAAPWSEIVRQYGDPGVLVYNTPLFEALASFSFFVLFWALRKKEFPLGVKVFSFLILHAIVRFLVEIIRLNPENVFGMTQGQFISIGLILIGLTYIGKVFILDKKA